MTRVLLTFGLAPLLVGIIGVIVGFSVARSSEKDHKLAIAISREGTADTGFKNTIHLANTGETGEDDLTLDVLFSNADPDLKLSGPATNSANLPLSYNFTVTGKLTPSTGFARYHASASHMKTGDAIDFVFDSNKPIFVTAIVKSREASDAATIAIDQNASQGS